MSVSVCTLVKGRAGHLHRQTEGLTRSLVRPTELVVVDMTDPPIALPETPFPVVSVVFPTDGLPLSAARNLAAQHASGEMLLFLDVDCIPSADLIGRISTELDAHDSLACAEVRYLSAGAVVDGWSEDDLISASEPHPVRPFPPKGRRIETNAGLFWSLLFGVRRESYRRVGGFDEAFTGYGAEDTDFAFRATRAGLPLVFLGSGHGGFHQHHGVVDPPLQHFDSILANARVFHERWGLWPMSGWLDAFVSKGLICRRQEGLEILRKPTGPEIAEAAQNDRPF